MHAMLATAAVEADTFVRMEIPIESGRSTVVFQDGRPVAEVFRDDTNPRIEHWVLFAAYVEPGTAPHVVTTWIAGAKLYRGGVAEFFKRVPFAAGARYVKLDASSGKWLRG